MIKKPEPTAVQGVCVTCLDKPQMPTGRGGFKAQCRACNKVRFGMKNAYTRKYRQHAKPSCERCGFVPIHPVQIQVHHKDRDRSNGAPENLESLCCNCHALEHAIRPRK